MVGGVAAYGNGMVLKAPSTPNHFGNRILSCRALGSGSDPIPFTAWSRRRKKDPKENIPKWKRQEFESRGFDGEEEREGNLSWLSSNQRAEPCPGLAPGPVRQDLLQAAPSLCCLRSRVHQSHYWKPGAPRESPREGAAAPRAQLSLGKAGRAQLLIIFLFFIANVAKPGWLVLGPALNPHLPLPGQKPV